MPRLSKIGAAALGAFGWTGGAASVTASYLQVAGGGGSCNDSGGGAGGGAGGMLTGTTSLSLTTTYTVTVGAGGSGAQEPATNGSNSQFGTLTASVGGGGAPTFTSSPTGVGTAGGSGSGGINSNGATAGAAGGAGTSGQGRNGGASWTGSNTNDPNNSAGGGGGAGGVGGNGGSGTGGAGGVGLASSITGTSTYYAGGGGGGTRSAGSAGAGGNGGGGTGSNTVAGASGTANTGGGAGGSRATPGGNGGSGVVIISYLSPQKFGGGIVTTSGSNTIHTFQTSGTLSPLSTLSASYLIVAGGGGGGFDSGGGGGAGGFLSGSGVTIDTNSTYLVTVGAGGAGGTVTVPRYGANGTNSTFSMVTTAAVGGGGGGGSGPVQADDNGRNGGSGGGAAGYTSTPHTGGAGTSGQGNNGGSSSTNGTGAGGGGAGAVGASAGSGSGGGIGLTSSISGTSTYYAGGGGGANGSSSGIGGLGGGGNSSSGTGGSVPTAGTANTGGGGGSGNAFGGSQDAAAGGSGVVIISYAGSVQQMAGGTVTISGGNVIHTFTSSGYLTPLKFVGNSLRFRASNSAYLSRTPTVAGSRTTWTWSAWVKRGDLSRSAGSYGLFGCAPSGSEDTVRFNNSTSNALNFYVYTGGYVGQLETTQVFRDPAAWYHLVCVWDTTNATSTERMRVYVNGTRVTAFATATYPSLNAVSNINNSVATQLGWYSPSSGNGYFDGEMTEINFIDGQALTPNSFGTFNSYGVWQPITYGGSYGTNGFYLPFTNKTSTTTLGYDFSPQGNNWTTNNISLTAGTTYDSMTDVPTLTSATAANYAVLNPLETLPAMNLTQGNLNAVTTSGNDSAVKATFAIPTTGKYYWEVTDVNQGNRGGLGLYRTNQQLNVAQIYAYGYDITYLMWNGQIYQEGSLLATYTAASTGDVIMFAVDEDNGRLYVGKNGTWFNSGNPASGTGYVASLTSGQQYSPFFGETGGTVTTVNFTFGQRPFSYTPPSGFVALNTYNI
jgi:hypothetical protein